MSLKDQLMADLKTAMKSGDERRKSTIRMARSAIRYAEIDQRKELDDAGVLAVLAKEIKQRRESIEEYGKGGRQDLVDIEQAELEILLVYMPAQLSEQEIRDIVRAAVAEVGATGPRDIGKVMSAVTPKTRGRADGKVVSEIVREALAASGGG